ncbi:MAG: SRPBCC family protein [Gemmatimonas sp.]
MTNRASYAPGAAFGADVRKAGETWTLVLVRTLRHPPTAVWRALTDPAELREWAPFDVDRNLGAVGPAKLTTVGAPAVHITDGNVTRAEAPSLLEFTWGGNNMRWELEPVAAGTRLTLWHNINRHFIAMGAAGWHICLDVLDRFLENQPIGRIVAADAMQFGGWRRLHAEYAKQFGVETPDWPTHPK